MNGLGRFVGLYLTQLLEDVHSLIYFSNDYVLSIEIWDCLECEKELGGICILSTVGHGEQTFFRMIEKSRFFVTKLAPGISVLAVGWIDRRSASSIASSKVSGLDAKLRNDTMNLGT